MKCLHKLSDAYFNKQEKETKKNGVVPNWWKGITTISMNAVEEFEKEHKELQHHRDTTIGLYAFDKDLDSIFENIPSKESCKTSVEAYLVQQIEFLKSIVFKIK
jgi:hypothetical protein